jgi:hypothetical protein
MWCNLWRDLTRALFLCVAGIRIENLVFVRKAETPFKFGGLQYLGFEAITFVPLQKKMIDVSLLTDKEIAWVNKYHKEVRRMYMSIWCVFQGKVWVLVLT